ncbi:hypothetical protein RJ641_017149 [Dillenia turbinata]|uniref:F-box domain-containing protein n=1 Tax=Dillenia turbinata TaxID=194707 RepID=A0AAN8UXK5_9MAGN
MSSSSSFSTSSSSREDVEEGGDGGGGNGGRERTRRRSNNEIWPEPFVEALASQVAVDAARSLGRLSVAPALANLFQVCSTWRAVSRSDLLWQYLTRHIWCRTRLLHHTWRDEFIFRHRTHLNFRSGNYARTTLRFDPSDAEDNHSLACRCLALSDHHLASGFADGSVRLFHLPSSGHLSTFRPHHRDDRIGRFSRAVIGILLSDHRIVFASHDGDIHVASLHPPSPSPPTRRAHYGNLVNDGALVDFTGCNRWWVGLYAGVPGRSFRVWNGETEDTVFVGGTLTDPESVNGWRLLAEPIEFIGRIRITSEESAVACTKMSLMVFDLRNGELILNEDFRREVVVGAVDVSNDAVVIVDVRGAASVRRVRDLGQIRRFRLSGGGAGVSGLLGSMNLGYVLMWAGGVTRVWDREIDQGGPLYSFRERVGEVAAFVANDRHVAACATDTIIHLWDFGA